MIEVSMLLFSLLLLAAVVVVPLVALIRTFRINKIEQRLARIESTLARRRTRRKPRSHQPRPMPQAESPRVAESEPLEAIPVPEEEAPQPSAPPPRLPARPRLAPLEAARARLPRVEPSNLESWLGQTFLGWTAVVLLLFATAFFLKYAFDNHWIGPLGQVSIGLLAGAGLCVSGLRMHRRGRPLASQMLTAAGIVVLYLATFAAFGYYHLLPRDRAGVYLVLFVAQAALLAGLYNAEAIGIMAVVGGLLSPVLLRSDADQYRSLFLYLAVLDLGVVALAVWRRWYYLAPLALLGTQGLFWLWWGERYHPAKFAAVLTFQLVVFGLFLVHDLIAPAVRRRRAHPVQLVGIVANAFFLCAAGYVILDPDFHVWLPALALGFAALFAGLVRLVQARSPGDTGLQLTPLTVALALIATAIALRGEAGWVSLGWAVEGAALWWVGLRLRALPLRALAMALLTLAVGRFLFHETANTWGRQEFRLLVNSYALPGLAIAACLLSVARVTRAALPRREGLDQFAYWAGGLGGVLLGWLVLSVDLYQFADHWWRDFTGGDSGRFASTSLTVLWAAYAGVVLFFGFRLDSRPVRLTAQGLFLLAVGKAVCIDLFHLPSFFRVAAFFVLALLVGLAAFAYQRRFAKETLR